MVFVQDDLPLTFHRFESRCYALLGEKFRGMPYCALHLYAERWDSSGRDDCVIPSDSLRRADATACILHRIAVINHY
jgi:hypothetical protein